MRSTFGSNIRTFRTDLRHPPGFSYGHGALQCSVWRRKPEIIRSLLWNPKVKTASIRAYVQISEVFRFCVKSCFWQIFFGEKMRFSGSWRIILEVLENKILCHIHSHDSRGVCPRWIAPGWIQAQKMHLSFHHRDWYGRDLSWAFMQRFVFL